jgi:hypothetical protein
VQCGKAAAVRRVLDGSEAAQPVCVDCAERIELGDLSAPARETAGKVAVASVASSSAGFLLLAVLGLLFLGALVSFLHDQAR